MKRKVVAVIPAFNEEKRVGAVVKKAAGHVDVVLVVDDGSRDRTRDAAEKAGAIVLRLPVNMGVGFGTRAGAEYAISGLNASRIVLLDADGQHDPADIPRLIRKLDEGYGFVFASRSEQIRNMPLIKRFGNMFLTAVTNFIGGGNLGDTQTGFRAFTADAWKRLALKSDGYEICSEIAVEVERSGIKYCEVPIEAKYDEWTKVKGTDIVTGVKIFARMLWRRVAG